MDYVRNEKQTGLHLLCQSFDERDNYTPFANTPGDNSHQTKAITGYKIGIEHKSGLGNDISIQRQCVSEQK